MTLWGSVLQYADPIAGLAVQAQLQKLNRRIAEREINRDSYHTQIKAVSSTQSYAGTPSTQCTVTHPPAESCKLRIYACTIGCFGG